MKKEMKEKEKGKGDTIVVRLRPDEVLFLSEMCDAYEITRSQAVRLLVMVGRRLLQDEETGNIKRDILTPKRGKE